jgi:hypothetical protein
LSLEEYATEDGNSPSVGAVLRSIGCDESDLSIKNIEMVLLPALTVKRYFNDISKIKKRIGDILHHHQLTQNLE